MGGGYSKSKFWMEEDVGGEGKTGGPGENDNLMCIVSKAFHTNSDCTSAVSYTQKFAYFMD